MGREGGLSAFREGVPLGGPTQRRGAPPDGAGGLVAGPFRYVVGESTGSTVVWSNVPGAQAYGYTAPALLGIFDRRPWEAIPSRQDSDWIKGYAKPVMGQRLSCRIVAEPAVPLLPYPGGALTGPWRLASLSVIVAGWEASDGAVAPDPAVIISNPWALASRTWFPARLATLANNVLPDLMTQGVAEVDIGGWTNNTRFAAVWLWSFWLGPPALPGPLTVRASIVARPPSEYTPSAGITVSVPILDVPNGPLPADGGLNDFWSVWRCGTMPLRGSPQARSWGLANGGPYSVTVSVRYLCGPLLDPAQQSGAPTERSTVGPGQTFVARPATNVSGATSHIAFYVGNAAAQPTTGGPVILTVNGA